MTNSSGQSRNPNEQPFTQNEIEQYLAEGREADFLLELDVARLMDSASFNVEFSGRYDDPVSGKVREFDVRADRTDPSNHLTFWLSLECKNIPVYSPLLVMCSERVTGEENFQYAVKNKTSAYSSSISSPYKVVENASVFYQASNYYGRAVVQLNGKGRGKKNTTISVAKTETTQLHSKWEQAVASLSEKVRLVGGSTSADQHHFYPFIVVPNETLWVVEYSADGKVANRPTKRDVVYQQIWKECTFSESPGKQTLRLSKLHIVTFDGLLNFLQRVDKMFSRL